MFDKFPQITYDGRVIQDISKRLAIHPIIKNNASIFETYIVNEGEKIEDVAVKFYNDPNLHFVIMIMNNIIDPFYDWVLSYNELLSYVDNKYATEGGRTGIHHYELNGKVVDSTTVGAVSITNLQYEENLNESRRKIKILRQEYIPIVRNELETILKQ